MAKIIGYLQPFCLIVTNKMAAPEQFHILSEVYGNDIITNVAYDKYCIIKLINTYLYYNISTC